MSQLGKILLIFSGISLFSFVVVLTLLQAWVPFLWLSLAFFIVFGASGFWVDRKFYREFFGMKTTKQGLSMGSMVVMVLTILIAVNYLGARRYVTWDLSTSRVNSLSEQSIKLLDTLKDDLRVIYFYKDGTEGVEQNRKQFVDLLRKYQDHSSKVKLEFVEVNARPDLTEKYEIKQGSQSVLLDYQGRTSLIEKIDEQEITGALVKVSREKAKMVYVMSGHGEMSLERQEDGDSGSFLASLLQGNRYDVKDFSFSQAASIPADADVLLILGPKQQFLESEIQGLEAFLSNGGSLFLAVEPRTQHGLEGLLAKVGVKIANNYIVSTIQTPFGQVPDPKFTRGSVFSPSHPITKPFGQNQFTVFRFPQAVERLSATAPAGLLIDDLVRTNESSFAVTDMAAKQKGAEGPFTVVMSVKGKWPGAVDAKEFNLVVAGDREFLNDQSLYQNLNRDLLLNSMASLAKEENMVSITPKEVARTELLLVDTGFILYIFLFAIPLPLALYLSSFVFWWRRRNA